MEVFTGEVKLNFRGRAGAIFDYRFSISLAQFFAERENLRIKFLGGGYLVISDREVTISES